MAGLYDGIEEVGFKPIVGGYLFQPMQSRLFGPRRLYVVTAAQKAVIAARLKDTLQRLKPLVFVAAVVIPLTMILGGLWFALTGALLTMTVVDAKGHVTTTVQPLDPGGLKGILPAADGRSVAFTLSGQPGPNNTLKIRPFDAKGLPGALTVVTFGASGTSVTITDTANRTFSKTTFVERKGRTPLAILAFVMLLTFGLFIPYLAAIQLYTRHRLRPLLVGLPLSNERMSHQERYEKLAARISPKLLLIIGFGAGMACLGSVISIVSAVVEHRALVNPIIDVQAAGAAILVAQFAYLIWVRTRSRRLTH